MIQWFFWRQITSLPLSLKPNNQQNKESSMKTIPIFILKSSIFIFIFFLGLQAYLPEKTFSLLSEIVKEGLIAMDRESVQRQLIGSLSSEYAVDQKIKLLQQQNKSSLVEFAEEHKKSLKNSKM